MQNNKCRPQSLRHTPPRARRRTRNAPVDDLYSLPLEDQFGPQAGTAPLSPNSSRVLLGFDNLGHFLDWLEQKAALADKP